MSIFICWLDSLHPTDQTLLPPKQRAQPKWEWERSHASSNLKTHSGTVCECAPVAERCPQKEQFLAPQRLSEGVTQPDKCKSKSNLLKLDLMWLVRDLSCAVMCHTAFLTALSFLHSLIVPRQMSCPPEHVAAMEGGKSPQRVTRPVFDSYLGKKWTLLQTFCFSPQL